MNKREQFLIEVQTGVIVRSIKSELNAEQSMWEALIHMDDAFNASRKIPKNMEAHEAACEFLEFIFKDNKERSYAPPAWLQKDE
jgi:hypothetical protein